MSQIAEQVFSVNSFGNTAEHTSCLQSSRSWSVRNLYWNNAAIFGSFWGEIATETNQITYTSGFITCLTLRDLGCSCLSRYAELLASCRLGKPFRNHFPQNGANHGKCRIRTNFRINNLCRNLFQYISVFGYRFYEFRFHHYTIIGYSIIEIQNVDGRNHCFITDTHPRKSRFCKITLFRSEYAGTSFSHESQI